MRDIFEGKLQRLNDDLIAMGKLVESNIEKSLEALLNQDSALAEDVIASDLEINAYETKIEMYCVELLALQSPVASDLRRVFSVLKIVTDLERVGDNCVNICKVVTSLGKYKLIKPLVDLPNMGKRVKSMVFSSITAFVKSDIELARNTAMEDDDIDDLYELIYRDLLAYIKNDKQNDDQVIGLLLVGRYLERMADHATNVCERLIYLETGKNVKY